jgi:hypothetical protein
LIATGIAVGMVLCFTRTRPQGDIGDILLDHARQAEAPTRHDHGAPHLIIAAGGTGGHMFPAQALAEAMVRGAGG